jgi:NAD(P)-dependent dehydrogenase (short-subunit alcohol dehydrogenase family)
VQAQTLAGRRLRTIAYENHWVAKREQLGEETPMSTSDPSTSDPFTPAPASGRAALVTGGARRIGAAIVVLLARNGYAVAIHAHRSRKAAEALAQDIANAAGRAVVLDGDLADHEAVTTLVPAAAAALGPLTLLVNNAAEFEPDEIGTLEPLGFDRHIAVNLRAPLFLAQAFAAQASATQASASQAVASPSIVNLLDQGVLRPTPRFLSYGIAKSALHAATTTLAQALAPRVRVNAVAPGPTLPNPRQTVDAFLRDSQAMPLGHGATPEEIAAAVLYLAEARSVTGVTIAVDGGQHITWREDAVTVDE